MIEKRGEKICKIPYYPCLLSSQYGRWCINALFKKGQKLKLILQDIWKTVNSEKLKYVSPFYKCDSAQS